MVEQPIDVGEHNLGKGNLAEGVQWQPKARKNAPYLNRRGSWLIFCDSHGLGQALVTHLQEAGECCIQISPGRIYQALRGEGWYWLNPAHLQDFRRLFQELQASDPPPWRGVVHLWALDNLASEETRTTHLESVQLLGLTTLMYLIQGAARSDGYEIPQLWVVTRGTQRIGPAASIAQGAYSTLWEKAQACNDSAHPTALGALIDLDPACPCDEAALLFDELWHSDGVEDRIAFRQGQRYVPQKTAQ